MSASSNLRDRLSHAIDVCEAYAYGEPTNVILDYDDAMAILATLTPMTGDGLSSCAEDADNAFSAAAELVAAAEAAASRLEGMNSTGVIAKDNGIISKRLRAALSAFRGEP